MHQSIKKIEHSPHQTFYIIKIYTGKIVIYLSTFQQCMDKSQSTDLSRSPTSQKVTKKYKKVTKNVQKAERQESVGNQSSFDLTKTQINGLSNLDISSIHQNSVSAITQRSDIRNQSTFLGSVIHLKKELVNMESIPQQQQTYRNCSQIIDDKDILKVLKKYIKKVFPKAKNIQILSAQTKPSLIFHFNLINQKQTKKMSLKNIIKANKQLGKHESTTIEEIFDKLYFRIGEEYHKILESVFILAQKQRIQITSNIRKNPLLYYCIDKTSINFTLFDKEMRIFQFNSSMIKKLKLEPKHQKLWNKFQAAIQTRRKEREKIIEEYGEYEASSDEQSRRTIQYEERVDTEAIRRQIKKITSINLSQYQDEIEEKLNLFNDMQKKDDEKQKSQRERLADDVGELQNNLENFKETVEFIQNELQNLRPNDSQKYKNLLKKIILAKKQLQSKLPITARKRQIFNALDQENLIILEGQTGSGKSTQLPQMMCEYFKMFDEKGKSNLPILITQPRKLATRTVAERVASQMQEKVGGFVDYATSPHKQISKTAKIIFKMDSLVLDEITTDRLLSKYSCLIIDEAHERTISIDVILGLIKQLLIKRNKFKVIVTSASLDAKLFSDYFKTKVMKVSGRLHPVQIIHQSLNHESDTVKKIQSVIKKDILISNSQIRPEYKGDILVFCSGVEQINILCNIFHKFLNPRVFQVYPLHGRIAPSQQRLVFLQTKEYKLIFASRIAQTSITINGVKVVVDPGFDREEVYDQKNRVSSRKLINISQSSAKQRAGRAGRTSKGFCFRLYSEAQMNNFRKNKTPQIENMALDTLVLRLKMLGVKEIFKFAYINKPQDKALEKSIETLQMIGALNFAGDITTIGRLLLQLRIQPFLGRAIVEAIICQEIVKKTKFTEQQLQKWKQSEIRRLNFIRQSVVEILSMVINSSNIFTFQTQFDKNRDKMDEVKFKKFSDDRGDFFYLLNIYDQFINNCKHNTPQELNNWVRLRFLNKKTLYQAKQLIEQINETIKNFNFDLKDSNSRQLIDIIKIRMTQCKNADDVILSCMMTSFCVNLCLYSENPTIGYTLILQKKPIVIYGTSTLALLSKYPKWIICYDLKTNDKGTTYCQIAHEVDYKFLKKTVDDHVFQRLNLKEAEHMNPFYETLTRSFPTLILEDINNDYINRENSKNLIFKYLSLLINEETSTISLSWNKELKAIDIFGPGVKTTIRQYLQNYINQKIKEKTGNNLNFHLMSNIYLEMKDGFIVQKLILTSTETQFIASSSQQYLLYDVKNIFEAQSITCKKISNQKMKIVTIVDTQYLFVKKCLENYGIDYEQFVKQRKQQSLNARIYMKFYTGAKENKPIFMYYGRTGAQKVHKMCEILEECRKSDKIKTTQEKYRYFNVIWSCSFSTSKNATGIRCINRSFDAFQVKQAIEYLTINGVLPFDFIVPFNYQEFRQTNNVLAIKSEKQWQSDIEKVFAKEGFKNIAIKVKVDDRYNQQKPQNNMQSLIKKELTAEITGESIQKLDELVKKLDGKQKLIGAGKIHFRYNFKQFVVKVNIRPFKALKDSFQYIKDKYETFNAQLKVQANQRVFGKAPQVFISCRSPNRQRLLEPCQKIKELFTPFIIRLQSLQFNFLLSTQEGEDFLAVIEEDYGYHIYFGFERKKSQLKVYCEDDDFNDIQTRLMKMFANYTFYADKISYKGKGLNRVVDLIQKEIKKLHDINRGKKSDKFLEYRIIFKSRQVQIEGDIDSINKIKAEVFNLTNQEPGSCHICMKNTQKPYKLFNCQHSFCWKCLGDYIQQSRKEQTSGAELLCPQENCLKLINSHDIKVILSTQQFESFCLKRLRQYVKKRKVYFFCPTNGCDQIFQEETMKKSNSFECNICGKWYCSKCKQPHEHFTCNQWETKLANGQLSKFGFKKCKCGAVLQKEMREKIIQCKHCKEFLCWVCIKGWKIERDCQNHIKACKK